jgi:hypothetical protein
MGSPVGLYYLQKRGHVKAIKLTAYPAIIGGAAKTNSEGGESYQLAGSLM